MTTRLFLVGLLLLCTFLAGCNTYKPSYEGTGMSFDFDVKYEGASRGDDNDLYAGVAFPTDDGGAAWTRLSSDGSNDLDGYVSGGSYRCLANEPEWEGKWWLEVSLYEEKPEQDYQGRIVSGDLVNRERWPIDCIEYWITVDEQGGMQLHEGLIPRARPQGIPSVSVLTVLMGLGISLLVLRRG